MTVSSAANAQTDSKREWSDIAEIQIRPHQVGPVLWKLSKGASTIWVVGVLPAQFDDTRWDDTRLRRVMRGSRVIVLPVASSADKAAVALSEATAELPAGQHLADVVSPAIYARFKATVEQENLPVSAFWRLRPVRAGAMLFRNVLEKQSLTTSMPEYVGRLAQKQKVPVRRAGQVDGNVLLNHRNGLDAAASEGCLSDYLDGIDYDTNVFPKVIKAWGKGDIKTVTQNYRDQPYLACDLANPDMAAFIQTYAVDMMVDALSVELETPGKAMAVVDLSDLLRKGGVLDKLRAQGVEVTSPEM